ncbi:MAG: hypothetical protein ACLGIV_08850 [Actinomycetes bacterium]
MSTTMVTSTRNVPLIAARVVAGLLGGAELAGVTYFTLVAPEEAVWVGPWLDIPIVALMVVGAALQLGLALLPGLSATRRIVMGFVAAGLGIAVTLVKIPLYDEPEGVLFIGFDALLLVLLALAWRSRRR